MIKKIFQWFVYSSVNPQDFALTLKALVPLLIFFGLDEVTSTSLIGDLGDTILIIGQVISLLVTLFGLGRKIALTIYAWIKK